MLSFALMRSAFAADGGGGGGEEGSGGEHGGTGEDNNEAVGFAWVWFDQGGFVGDDIDPTQGWDEDSMDYFLTEDLEHGLVADRMNQIAAGAATPLGRMLTDNVEGTDKTAYQLYRNAALQALANAKARSGASRARIVGVGWTFAMNTAHEWYLNTDYYLSSSWLAQNGLGPRRTFTDLLGYEHCWGSADPDNTSVVNYLPDGYHYVGFGNAMDSDDGLSSQYGWDNLVDVVGYGDKTWREYAYAIGERDNTGLDYVWVVVAVADMEPDSPIVPRDSGFLMLTKELVI